MKSGSWETAAARALVWRPIAPIIRLALWIRPEMSGARSARAPESCEVSTISRSKAGVSRVSSSNTRLEVERNGFR